MFNILNSCMTLTMCSQDAINVKEAKIAEGCETWNYSLLFE